MKRSFLYENLLSKSFYDEVIYIYYWFSNDWSHMIFNNQILINIIQKLRCTYKMCASNHAGVSHNEQQNIYRL